MVLAGAGVLLPGSARANYCSFGANTTFAACTSSTTFVVNSTATLKNLDFTNAVGDGFFSFLEQGPGSNILEASVFFQPRLQGPAGPASIAYDLLIAPLANSFFVTAGLTSQGSSQPVSPVYTVIKDVPTDTPTLELSVNQSNTFATKPFEDVNLNSIRVVDTFSVDVGSLVGFINTFELQDRAPGDTVPGPLPLLGAGAAFGFSRRLRSRVLAARRG